MRNWEVGGEAKQNIATYVFNSPRNEFAMKVNTVDTPLWCDQINEISFELRMETVLAR